MGNGGTTALAGIGATQAVTLLLYIMHKCGVDDMTPEVASAFVGVGAVVVGWIVHRLDARRPDKRRSDRDPTPEPLPAGAQT